MTEKAPASAEKKPASVFVLSDFNSRTHLTEKGKLEDDDYEPFKERNLKNPNSTSGALIHLLKSSLGTGILAMPMAFSNAGLLLGMVGTLLTGILCTHCVHILVRTSHQICRVAKEPSLGFAETAGKVVEFGPMKLRPLAKYAKDFVDFALMATYYSASCVYIVFISQSFHDVINYDLKLNWDIRLYIAMTLLPILVLGQIRELKYLVPFSALANIFIIITFGITLYYMFNEELHFEDKPLFASLTQFPLFFSTVIFAMEGIGVVMPVENSMKKPQHFLGCPGVLNTAMAVVIGLYAIIGFFGYVRFGDTVRGSITLNLKDGEVLADVAKIFMALAILFTYSLQFYVPMDILWRKISHRISEDKHNLSQIALRTGIILITGAIAALVPSLEPFIGLVGAVFFSILGLMIPAVVETIFLWPNGFGWCRWILWKNILISIFSVFALITGATVSIKDIVELYGPGHQKH